MVQEDLRPPSALLGLLEARAPLEGLGLLPAWPWRAAIDRYNPQARNVRVTGSHLGLGVNPMVWRIIALTLAGNPGA